MELRMRSAERNVKGKNREKRGSTLLNELREREREREKSEITFQIRIEQK
jgi:hypothetical protein